MPIWHPFAVHQNSEKFIREVTKVKGLHYKLTESMDKLKDSWIRTVWDMRDRHVPRTLRQRDVHNSLVGRLLLLFARILMSKARVDKDKFCCG